MSDSNSNKRLEEAEIRGWKLHNEEKPYEPTAEESLTWLEGIRAFMFEIWKNNPSLLKAHEKFRRG